MVWYAPPLSPIQSVADAGGLPSNGNILPAVESLRIPAQYLANLLSAGDTGTGLARAETDDGDAPLQALANRRGRH